LDLDSDDFTGYSIWIDPIKPAITSSGFVNNNIIYSGLSQDEENVLSSGVTPTSGVGNLNVYVVSGVLDYKITITETFNNYTSGAVKWEVTLIPTDKYVASGLVSGAIPSSFVHDSESYLREADGSSALLESGVYNDATTGEKELEFNLDTSGLENGAYELVVDLLDYAGNTNKVIYVLYVNNPLQFIDVTQLDNNQLSLNFSNTIKLSGLFVSSGFESGLRVVVDRDNSQSIINTRVFSFISNPNNARSIIISIVQNTPGEDQFNFLPGDVITVTIEQPGIDRLFNITDEAILELTPNIRQIIWAQPQ
jgi:hypothetical protein